MSPGAEGEFLLRFPPMGARFGVPLPAARGEAVGTGGCRLLRMEPSPSFPTSALVNFPRAPVLRGWVYSLHPGCKRGVKVTAGTGTAP